MNNLSQFIKGLPKAELHLHIEGSLEPTLMFQLAERNRIKLPFKDIESVKEAYNFNNLQEFLNIYYQSANVLRTEEDFRDLARDYFYRASRDNVIHSEIFFDPQTHTDRGIPFDVVMRGLLAGIAEAESQLGMTVQLIMCFLRHLDEESAFTTLRMAEPWLDKITAVGLDSSEVGHPPSKFKHVFATARQKGLKLVAHAGEEGPPSYIDEAIDVLKVDRLDHGNRIVEDPLLVTRMARSGMTFTLCPLSNQKLQVVKDLKKHPLPYMLKHGLRVTINSDDPAYFGGYVNDNYQVLAENCALDANDFALIARNSFLGSFLSDETVTHYIEVLDKYTASFEARA
ncbi:adenosine deaminase [Zymomonas mobilis]|uniref:Adenine deaminase n=1 Tax=Zymomonas mobilis subsp. pomaceae (strain ATCC 29192 / DSM 22645 / JCM 10191 / CCUG 17912 / NBRC 13757 / NCIMB 11200 / NRRL B-4491 / Barker I) TaxID=579138 RepID=F8EUJ2_ZYMMT|nr:adenosine deaminase [Zymomonas mobilis]AEI37208.1 adenosine deaminase [Zymomonas mobilis subsp. pomaceae ATCC 29192]MDX5948578.1 adenosine deaminase [Zymomonas mobilis subsp. pomaceae]GEB88384.1 adenine deaminase [Zymomonas mobilis subsp. pomaceae]